MNTYSFRILTPLERKLDATVVSIVAPGEAGYLGVLANHAPIITTLKPGYLRVTLESDENKWFKIDGGILKVANNEAVLLTESIEETQAPSD